MKQIFVGFFFFCNLYRKSSLKEFTVKNIKYCSRLNYFYVNMMCISFIHFFLIFQTRSILFTDVLYQFIYLSVFSFNYEFETKKNCGSLIFCYIILYHFKLFYAKQKFLVFLNPLKTIKLCLSNQKVENKTYQYYTPVLI